VYFYFLTAVRKLENAVLKLYLVNAVASGKTDKVTEFFARFTPELIGQPEWKEWFSKLPYWSMLISVIQEYAILNLQYYKDGGHI
jgi:hypothetical protein